MFCDFARKATKSKSKSRDATNKLWPTNCGSIHSIIWHLLLLCISSTTHFRRTTFFSINQPTRCRSGRLAQMIRFHSANNNCQLVSQSVSQLEELVAKYNASLAANSIVELKIDAQINLFAYRQTHISSLKLLATNSSEIRDSWPDL